VLHFSFFNFRSIYIPVGNGEPARETHRPAEKGRRWGRAWLLRGRTKSDEIVLPVYGLCARSTRARLDTQLEGKPAQKNLRVFVRELLLYRTLEAKSRRALPASPSVSSD
jgi:hypothetical protein